MTIFGQLKTPSHPESVASNKYEFFHRVHFVVLLAVALVLLALPTLKATAQTMARKRVTVTILHLSNVFRASPVDGGTQGGLARVGTVVKQIRAQSRNTLVLFGGNTISPSVESITFQGDHMIRAWNAVGLDYAVVGNHEFDFGPAVLKERISQSSFKWLATNVIDKETQAPFANTPPHIIHDFEGVKIGLFGLTEPDAKRTSKPGPALDFQNPCDTASKTVQKLKAEGAHFIIALSHLPLAENKALVSCAPAINLVLGGAEYIRLESFVQGRPVFTVDSDARHIGRFDISFSADISRGFDYLAWDLIPIDSRVREDQAVAEVIKQFGMSDLATTVGQTTVTLEARSEESRTRETNLGCYIADQFQKATNAHVAFINGGAIRADTIYPAGALTKRDILSIFPFQNKVLTARVTGRLLRKILEHSVSLTMEEAEPGRFLQVSGLKYVFDATRPAGSRVVGVTIQGKLLDETATYTIATIGYLFNGGDEYSMLKEATDKVDSSLTDSEILLKAISADRVISPKVEGRILRLDKSSRIERR